MSFDPPVEMCVCGHSREDHTYEAVGQIAGPATACEFCPDCEKFTPVAVGTPLQRLIDRKAADIEEAAREVAQIKDRVNYLTRLVETYQIQMAAYREVAALKESK